MRTKTASSLAPESVGEWPRAFRTSLDILHGAAVLVADRVAALTGGRFTIRVFPAGELVPALQVMDGSGVRHGTRRLHQRLLLHRQASRARVRNRRPLRVERAATDGVATPGGWGGTAPGDLRGLRNDRDSVRPDTGSPVRRVVPEIPSRRSPTWRACACAFPDSRERSWHASAFTVQVLGGPDVYPALERGVIDAVEWVGPFDDEKLGFHEIAKNYYIPGWWEPGPSTSLQIGLDAWNDLPPSYQAALESACNDATLMSMGRYDVENPKALARLINEHGVTLRRFSDEILEAAWNESEAYLEEQATANEDFRRIYASWRAFRDGKLPVLLQQRARCTPNFAFPRNVGTSSGVRPSHPCPERSSPASTINWMTMNGMAPR